MPKDPNHRESQYWEVTVVVRDRPLKGKSYLKQKLINAVMIEALDQLLTDGKMDLRQTVVTNIKTRPRKQK